MRRFSPSLAQALAASLLLTPLAACSSERAAPSPPPIVLTLPAVVQGQIVSCAGCQEPSVSVVIAFAVTIGDPNGSGGTLERLTTVVMNRSRGIEAARNVRPNADYAFPSIDLPAGGQLVVQAGAVSTVPPPRDEMAVTVVVRLTDGREASASASLAVVAFSPTS